MRKVLLSFFIVLVLLWSVGTVFAKKESKGGQGKRARKVQEKSRSEDKGKAVEKDTGGDKTVKRDASRSEGKSSKGKGHQRQLEALEKQMVQEEAKHLKRAARLERIRDLANEGGDTKVVARVNKLLEKEQQRYDRKRQRMQERKQKTQQLGEDVGEDDQKTMKKGKSESKGKGKGKSDDKGERKGKDSDEESEE